MLFSVSEKDLLTSSFQSGKHGLPSYPPPPPPKPGVFPLRKLPRTSQAILIQITYWTSVPNTLLRHRLVGPESSLK